MIELHHGDCLDVMQTLQDHSFDAIIADLPYGTTACKWDSVIPFKPLWKQYKRLIKKRGAIVLFGSQPFTSELVMSNVKWFRDEWIWEKSRASRHLDANRRVLKAHESVLLFAEGPTVYHPQMRKGKMHKRNHVTFCAQAQVYGKYEGLPAKSSDEFYPRSVLFFSNVISGPQHPTQKPVALLEYLIHTYTNEGDTVLDNTAGSGTTMVACVNTKRNGVGIEMMPVKADDPDYFGIMEQRIEKAQNEMLQLALV